MVVYVISVVVSLLLMSVLFFALRSTVKRIDHNTKKFFLDKLQDYDYLIEEKQKELDDICNKIGEKSNELEKLNIVNPVAEKSKKQMYYSNDKMPVYSDENIFKKYKKIKENFSLNYELIIKDFLNNNIEKENLDYQIALQLKQIFNKNELYKILNLKKSEQRKYIINLLNIEQQNFIINNINQYEIKKLILKLDDYIDKNDPIVYVYIGEENEKLKTISDRIKVIVDKNINEGIKINYKGILYDYSL